MPKIAAEGFQLTNYNVEAECTPSRSALMTGRYGIRTRQRQEGPPRGVWYGITKWEITLAEMLTDQGYTTGIFGKWHLGDAYPYAPRYRGFQDTVHHLAGGVDEIGNPVGNDYFDDIYYRNGVAEKFEGYCL